MGSTASFGLSQSERDRINAQAQAQRDAAAARQAREEARQTAAREAAARSTAASNQPQMPSFDSLMGTGQAPNADGAPAIPGYTHDPKTGAYVPVASQTAPTTQPGQPSFSTPSGTATNTAAPDPNLTSMVQMFRDRLKQMQGQGPAQDQGYTDKAIAQARGNIADQASGRQDAVTGQLAARGMVGSGSEVAERRRIQDAAQRLGARAASDISLARQRDLEQNDLNRGQMQNQFLLGGQGIMQAPAQLALSQQDLGLRQGLGYGNLALNQQQAAAGQFDSRMATILALMRMQQSGYGY